MSDVLSAWFLKVTLGTRSRLLELFMFLDRLCMPVPAAASSTRALSSEGAPVRVKKTRQESRAYDSVRTEKTLAGHAGWPFLAAGRPGERGGQVRFPNGLLTGRCVG